MSCWDILGIAPTRDMAAIKGAYAALLKATRPDEDAEGYQGLRDSFQAALAYAKAPIEKKKESEPVAATGDAGSDTSDQDAVDALIATLLDQWRKSGDEALLAAWPNVEAALDVAPLTATVLYSTGFARLMIGQAYLPFGFVDALRRRFGWGQDVLRKPRLTAQEQLVFQARLRAAAVHMETAQRRAKRQQLAEDQAHGLAEARRRQQEEAIRVKYAELLRFAGQAGQMSTWQATLAPADLVRLCDAVTPAERAILGLDDERYQQACSMARRSAQVRTAAGVGMVAIAAAIQLVYRGMDLLSVLVVAVCALCFFAPLGQWMEWLRVKTRPKPDTEEFSEMSRNLGGGAHIISIGSGLMAVLFSTLSTGSADASVSASVWSGFLTSVFLWAMWAMPPRQDDPLIRVIPAVFIFCVAGVASFDDSRPWAVLALAALCHACAYAAQRTAGLIILSILGGTALSLSVLWTGQPSFITIGVLVVWLMFAVASHVSSGLALAVMSISAIYNPYRGSDMFVLWPLFLALTMAGLWLLIQRYGQAHALPAE